MSWLVRSTEDTVTLSVDRQVFSRKTVKRAAAIMADRCHVLLDLDDDGSVLASLRLIEGAHEDDLRHLAGEFGNLLVADLAERKLDAQTKAIRNLLLARALDGALPKSRSEQGAPSGTPRGSTEL
jgi:His-Xaa-Ser system protein HxsD